MKIFVETKEGFDFYFEALEEHLTLKELLPDNTDEDIEEIKKDNCIFCAKISIEKKGVELDDYYLGGCIYEAEEDFYIKYKTDYFDDIVKDLIVKAKKTIENLTKN